MSASAADRESLSGTVAVVTGGGRGIGRVIALALARQGAAIPAFYDGDRMAVLASLSSFTWLSPDAGETDAAHRQA